MKPWLIWRKSSMSLKRSLVHSSMLVLNMMANETALRWFPIRNSKKVVLDHSDPFGKPIVTYGKV